MSTQDPARRRIVALDIIRGFALCGILLANIKPIANAGAVVISETSPKPGGDDGSVWLGLLVEQRFLPIFSLLFGIGFALLLRASEGRTASPRLLLLRRLLALLAIGVAHFVLLWQGDILSTYAVMGILVLLPSTWLPRVVVAGLSGAFLLTSLLTGDSRFTIVAGLFLLGAALVRYGVIDRIDQYTLRPALIGLGFAAVAAPVLWWQAGMQADDRLFPLVFALGGLLLAGVYVCAVLLLLRTPLRPFLRAMFAPLGQMALTNYLTATVLVLAVGRALGSAPDTWSTTTVLVIAAAILALQWIWSTLWLRRYRHGPVEWLWRWATWTRRPPLRRSKPNQPTNLPTR
ncbi:DUF418 domain-containing protein [Amycolatopsis sp. YIM 10]|uniref:DUF418 domain-containing protein n=1 Tax=Amycolatopsis sp. YIM 10 TaxID=2653857 RepID=UPI00129076A8|nr:DUF418 domain-containing protein [Amycolatopsis sp. YIM 10]QFU86822.1 hypothetical protein YIM_08055 [Amycolatopsis sp. YIM 10]